MTCCLKDFSLISNGSAFPDDDDSIDLFRLPFGESVLDCTDAWFFSPDRQYVFGKLFLVTNFVCFQSRDGSLRFCVPLCAIAFALPAKTFLVLPNAIQLITNVRETD